jgi:hypothetical protein
VRQRAKRADARSRGTLCFPIWEELQVRP